MYMYAEESPLQPAIMSVKNKCEQVLAVILVYDGTTLIRNDTVTFCITHVFLLLLFLCNKNNNPL